MLSSKKPNIAAFSMVIGVSCICKASDISVPELSSTIKRQSHTNHTHIERIAVTGSHLTHGQNHSTHTLVTISDKAIAHSAFSSLSEVLISEVPQINEGISHSNSQNSTHNSGLSTIDLRGLGLNRTLTLIDGRRVVSNSYSGDLVSLSTLPKGIIERVEIITGGASAAYGSGAISGVVNILTKQAKDDMSFSVRIGESTSGGDREVAFNGDIGTHFADGQGMLLLSTSYLEQFGLDYWDRSRAQQQDDWRYDHKRMCNTMLTAMYDSHYRTAYRCMRDIEQSEWTSLSDALPGGVFNETSSFQPNSGFWYEGQTLRQDWQEEAHGIHYNQFNKLKIPNKQFNIAVKSELDLSLGNRAYFQIHHSQNDAHNVKSPENEDECDMVITFDPSQQQFGSDCIGTIPFDNPYVPAQIRAQVNHADIKWDRLFQEVGLVTNDNTRATTRAWAGLNGFFNNDWQWDTAVGYGMFKQKQTRFNEIRVAHVRQALTVEQLEDGSIRCRDPKARKSGCVPINLFGEGAISDAAANYIRANPTLDTEISLVSLSANVSGPLVVLPSGPVDAVFGFDYRKDKQSVSTNVPNGGVTFNYIPNFSGDVSSYEVFTELSFPLLNDLPFAKHLNLSLSARAADYSWAKMGLIQSYNLGLSYQPTSSYSLKLNWAKAMRAPTITELMSPVRGDYNAFYDICDGVTATSTLAGHENCRKNLGIQSAIAQDGVFHDHNNSYSPNIGNPNLKPETAYTSTLDFVVTPQVIPNLTLSASLYRIKIEDVITTLSHHDIMMQCYQSSALNSTENLMCQDIKRDQDGQIIELKQRLTNANELITQGYDVTVKYIFPFNTIGQINFDLTWNHVIEHALASSNTQEKKYESHEGYLDHNIFEDTATASVVWQNKDWRVRWSTYYKGPIKRSKRVYQNWHNNMALNTENCNRSLDSCIATPELLWGNDLPSFTTHALNVSYRHKITSKRVLSFSGGIHNLFDNKGPFIIGGNGNFHSAYGGGRGRYVSLKAQYSF
ncbi:TonB-dependent receptor domain-containing protein [Pseudoalteromonas obscura]|uniref:TonB-dependent receptor n=1 Tax=Pseudoalteromonas obscura TaxID=3048491 RepID=A0ABT7EM64_9GAMM|nr:TonB-dependent receptor [Pseudoalteromonas sp. P94(2023)]MDK2596149.1 TonB-dependent receptor [Pseudoalteromonas sp. P94(2023)]